MNKKILLFLFFTPLVLLICWTLFLDHQRVSGAEVKVVIRGYDPVDLLSGHYISYQIDWNKTDCTQFPEGRCPSQEVFCKSSRWGRQCRFYIPEKHARELDTLFRKYVWRSRDANDMTFEVVYSYKKGFKPIAKQLLINGRDWRESISK